MSGVVLRGRREFLVVGIEMGGGGRAFRRSGKRTPVGDLGVARCPFMTMRPS
ncbi:MAG: hypothetical protein ABR971_04670 [Acidobacteriaceae bacterium]